MENMHTDVRGQRVNTSLTPGSWECGDLMVSVLDSGSRGLGSRPVPSHCVVFLRKTLYPHSASLHPGV